MALFYKRKPRSFHHEYIYVDERKEFVEKLKAKHEKKKESSDIENFSATSSYTREAMEERVRAEFRTNLRRRSGNSFLKIMPIGLLFLLLLLMFVAAWFCFS